jgi:hypothetical protein
MAQQVLPLRPRKMLGWESLPAVPLIEVPVPHTRRPAINPDSSGHPLRPARRRGPRCWRPCSTFFVVALDAQIVNVVPPEIRDTLGGGPCCSGSLATP